MRLYAFVAGVSSELAARLKKIAEQCPPTAQFEIIDVLQNPEFAVAKGVSFTPMFLIENGHDDIRVLASEADLDKLIADVVQRNGELALEEVQSLTVQLENKESADANLGLLLIDRRGVLLEADAAARQILRLDGQVMGKMTGIPMFRPGEALRFCVLREGGAFWVQMRCLTAQQAGVTALLVRPDPEMINEAMPERVGQPSVGILKDWLRSDAYFESLKPIFGQKLDIAVLVLPDLDVAVRTFGMSYVRKIEDSFIGAMMDSIPRDATAFRLATGMYVIVSTAQHRLDMAVRRIYAMRLYLGGAAAGSSSLAVTIKPKIRRVSDELIRYEDIRGTIENIAEGLARERVFVFDSTAEPVEQSVTPYASALVEADLQSEFYIVVQPVIRLSDEQIVGGEVLIRWNSPQLGLISPATFIPIAEQVGLIDRLSLFVLDQALQLLQKLEPNEKAYSLAINLSPNSLKSLDFRNEFIARLQAHPQLCPRLGVEITERYRMTMSHELRDFLEKLSELRVEFFIDDFGSGNASLNLLKDCRISTLKLAGELADELRHETDHTKLLNWLEQVVMLAHGMGARVLAEGIETEEQLHEIKRIGVDEVQGYYYAKPMPSADFLSRIGVKSC